MPEKKRKREKEKKRKRERIKKQMFDMAEEIAALRRHYQNQQGDRALGALEALQRLSDAISGFSIGEQTLTQQSNCKTNRKRGQPDESGRTWED